MAVAKDASTVDVKNETLADTKSEVSAADQAAVQKSAQEGLAPSDLAKEANVANGGFDGEGIPPGPSGAIMEAEIRENQQLEHPAVDNKPRKGLPADAMRIDFNDPTFG